MIKMAVYMCTAFFLAVNAIAASRPEQDQLTPEQYEKLSQEEYVDFVLRNIISGGVERDDIPPIDSPIFLSARDVDYLKGKDIVFGIILEGQGYAFPKKILYWHEIVNLEMNNQKYSVTFCPLTGSAIGFLDRNLGVSGYLFNNNLIMYDRETQSNIPQILEIGVDGELRGIKLRNFPVVATLWERWRNAYPETLVLSIETGYSRNYSRSPYPGYEGALRFWFPVSASSDRFHAKEVMVGFKLGGKFYAVRKRTFAEKNQGRMQIYDLNGSRIKVIHNERFGNIEVFKITGEGVGSAEKTIHSFEVFWFAWYAYFPNTIVLE